MSLMDSVGRLIVNTIDSVLWYVSILYRKFEIESIILTCLFIILSFRFILKPVLGGNISSRGSDKVRRDIHNDKESFSNG